MSPFERKPLKLKSSFILIAYSGHAFVAADIILAMGDEIVGYCDNEHKELNPYNIPFLGKEAQATFILSQHQYFVSIGDNQLRSKISKALQQQVGKSATSIIHPSAIIASNANIGEGCMIAARVVVNPLAEVSDGTILNTGCIIEHECKIGAYAHIAPGAVLAGNVSIGENTFVGANAVVKQGVIIGKNVIVGAGSVIINDVSDGKTIVGNPGRVL